MIAAVAGFGAPGAGDGHGPRRGRGVDRRLRVDAVDPAAGHPARLDPRAGAVSVGRAVSHSSR